VSLRWSSFSSVFLRYALGLAFLSASGGQVRSVGTVWATECLLGKFLKVLGIHAHDQLVCADGNDPRAGDHRHCR
jgi:hypothetical protein